MTEKNVVSARVFRAVYLGINSMGASINSIPVMIELMRAQGLHMGEHCRSRRTLTNIIHSMSDSMHVRLCTYIKNSNDPMVIIFDGSTDKGKSFLLLMS